MFNRPNWQPSIWTDSPKYKIKNYVFFYTKLVIDRECWSCIELPWIFERLCSCLPPAPCAIYTCKPIRQWPVVCDLCHTICMIREPKNARDLRTRIGFWLAYHAKTGYKIWYLGPLPSGQRLQQFIALELTDCRSQVSWSWPSKRVSRSSCC